MKIVSLVLLLVILWPANSLFESEQEEDDLILRGNESRFAGSIVLTIDDCSIEANVRWALDLLRNRGLTATFFPNTRYINNQDPQLWRDIVTAGNEIGYHTRWHQSWLTAEQLDTDFDLFVQEIREILGDPTYEIQYIRPPNGVWDEEWLSWGTSRNLITVQWNATIPLATPEQVLGIVRNRARGGSIILAHTGMADLRWLQDNLDDMMMWTDANGEPLYIRSISDAGED